VASTTKDQRRAGGTQSLGPTSPPHAPTTSPEESDGESVLPSAVLPAACSQERGVSQEESLCQRSLVGSHASTSSTLTAVQRCPVTGKPIPPLEVIEKSLNRDLILSSWCWPRNVVVKGMAQALRKWACEVGLEKAATRGKILFESVLPLRWAELLDEPTPELLADRLGGLVNELERPSNAHEPRSPEEHGGCDQQLLPSSGTSDEGNSGGSEPSGGRSDGSCVEAGDGQSSAGARVIEFPTGRSARDGTREGLSRREVAEELAEHVLDLQAFKASYAAIHDRVQSVKDEGRLMGLVYWTGTSAAMGTIDLCIHSIEGVVGELQSILQRIDAGVISNLDED